jgi:hypothetical protein
MEKSKITILSIPTHHRQNPAEIISALVFPPDLVFFGFRTVKLNPRLESKVSFVIFEPNIQDPL